MLHGIFRSKKLKNVKVVCECKNASRLGILIDVVIPFLKDRKNVLDVKQTTFLHDKAIASVEFDRFLWQQSMAGVFTWSECHRKFGSDPERESWWIPFKIFWNREVEEICSFRNDWIRVEWNGRWHGPVRDAVKVLSCASGCSKNSPWLANGLLDKLCLLCLLCLRSTRFLFPEMIFDWFRCFDYFLNHNFAGHMWNQYQKLRKIGLFLFFWKSVEKIFLWCSYCTLPF